MDPHPDPVEEALDDPNDLIVGAVRAPAWLTRISPLTWLFIALALLDVAFRVADRLPRPPDAVAPVDLADLVLSALGGAAVVLLPTAILVGGQRLDTAGRWLLQGAVALAGAELVRLLGQAAIDRLIGPLTADAELSGFMTRLLAVGVAGRLLSLFGLAKLGLGLNALAPASRGPGRWLPTIVIATFAVAVVETAISLQPFLAQAPDPLQLAYAAVTAVGSLLSLGLWGWLVVVARRRQGRSWSWLRAGGVGLVLAFGVSAVGGLVFLTRSDSPEALSMMNWFGLAATACAALGSAALCVGLALAGHPHHEAGDDGPLTEPFMPEPYVTGA